MMDVKVARMTEQFGGNGTASTCVFWLTRTCSRDPCRFLHRAAAPSPCVVKACQKSSTTCKYWMNGNCMYGDRCRNLHSWSDVEGEETFVGMQNVVMEDNPRPKRLVWWTPPPRGFFKINCDGAFTVHGNKAAAGGVLRDWQGKFILGFSCALNDCCCSALEAELWAIKIGMQTAICRRYSNLIVESDSLGAIQIINDEVQQSHSFQALLSSIDYLAGKVDQICWNHVFRETNSVADGLAKHGLSLSHDQGIKVFESPPYFIEIPLCVDRAGKVYCR